MLRLDIASGNVGIRNDENNELNFFFKWDERGIFRLGKICLKHFAHRQPFIQRHTLRSIAIPHGASTGQNPTAQIR